MILWVKSISPALAQRVRNQPAMQETQEVWSLGQEDPLEEEMAIHSSILAWRTPRIEEPGELQSMGLQSQTDPTKQLCTHHMYTLIKVILRLGCPLSLTWTKRCLSKNYFSGTWSQLHLVCVQLVKTRWGRPNLLLGMPECLLSDLSTAEGLDLPTQGPLA